MVTETTRLAYRRMEAAKAIDVSTDTLDRLIQRGEIKSFKIGAAICISADELTRFIREREAAGGG